MQPSETTLIITLDSLHAIPSKKELLELLKNHILVIKMGLLRNIEQRIRLSKKLCNNYSELFNANNIDVFPAPLSTHQNDTRTLSPRHLAHLVSTEIPQLDSRDSPEEPQGCDSNGATRASTEQAEAEPTPSASTSLLPRQNSPSIPTAEKAATPPSLWRRFLQAIHIAGLLIVCAAAFFSSAKPTPVPFDSSLAALLKPQNPDAQAQWSSRKEETQARHSHAPRNRIATARATRTETPTSPQRPTRTPQDPNRDRSSLPTPHRSAPRKIHFRTDSFNPDATSAPPTTQPPIPHRTSNRDAPSPGSPQPRRQTTQRAS